MNQDYLFGSCDMTWVSSFKLESHMDVGYDKVSSCLSEAEEELRAWCFTSTLDAELGYSDGMKLVTGGTFNTGYTWYSRPMFQGGYLRDKAVVSKLSNSFLRLG